ncbi:hypothetical protein [Sphingobacterium gobiense]|uniref:Uncharacterized protein n=1 Tax=Sphingobacterium gobiense TaxID=1382456 RepID=A0A2S9JMU1_9SPHI|nr:hypothetical protein [Sphingobacterium gobiense]PRD54451.1 hypothetical protein C5749_13420 [Sphingobacterium gobiense]
MKEDNTYYDGMDGLNLPGSLRINPFMVPESYFSQLTDNIQFHVKMEQYKNVVQGEWEVPPGYFETLSDKILSQTSIEAVAKQEALDVPAGYFENLSERIQTTVFEDKLKERIATDGFTIPDGYTGILKDKILAQTASKERKKTMVRRLNSNKWIQYVAAACAALVIGVASYNSIDREVEESFYESHLSSIPDDEIIHYLSALNDSHDILYIMECIDHSHDAGGVCTHVKENDIEDYLNYAL